MRTIGQEIWNVRLLYIYILWNADAKWLRSKKKHHLNSEESSVFFSESILSPCNYLFVEESFITDAYWLCCLCCLCLVMPVYPLILFFQFWISKVTVNCSLFLLTCVWIYITIALEPSFQVEIFNGFRVLVYIVTISSQTVCFILHICISFNEKSMLFNIIISFKSLIYIITRKCMHIVHICLLFIVHVLQLGGTF